MCYRTSNTATLKQLQERYQATFFSVESYVPYFHLAAFSQPTLNILTTEDPHEFRPYIWGLIPPWEKSYAKATERMLMCANARGEEIAEKPSYRDAWRKNQRCLIPVTGFFESHTVTKQTGKTESIPYFIEAGNEPIFSLGGVFNSWADPVTGEIHPTFTMLTVSANPLMKRIHNSKERMPLILSAAGEKQWLDPTVELKTMKDLIAPNLTCSLKAHPVSKNLHNPRFNANINQSVIPYHYEELEGVIP